MITVRLPLSTSSLGGVLDLAERVLAQTSVRDDSIGVSAFFSKAETASLLRCIGLNGQYRFGCARADVVDSMIPGLSELRVDAGQAKVALLERYDVPTYDWDEKPIGHSLAVTARGMEVETVRSWFGRSGRPCHETELHPGGGVVERMFSIEFETKASARTALACLVRDLPALFPRSGLAGFVQESSSDDGEPSVEMLGAVGPRMNLFSSDSFALEPKGMLRAVPNTTLSALRDAAAVFSQALGHCSLMSFRRQSFGWKHSGSAHSRRQAGNSFTATWKKGQWSCALGIDQYASTDVSVRAIKKYLSEQGLV